MVTRAQAEALLTLAESLEACERLNVTLSIGPSFLVVHGVGPELGYLDVVNGTEVREFVSWRLKNEIPGV